MNWSNRAPNRRAPRRTTNPYPIRFRAVCSCGWSMGAHEVDRAGGAAYAHGVLTGHVDTVEVVRADDIS